MNNKKQINKKDFFKELIQINSISGISIDYYKIIETNKNLTIEENTTEKITIGAEDEDINEAIFFKKYNNYNEYKNKTFKTILKEIKEIIYNNSNEYKMFIDNQNLLQKIEEKKEFKEITKKTKI